MEAALVSAATGALKPVLGKLATLLGDEYKLLKGVHGEIKFLRTELAAMHAFLLKMSEEEDPDVQDKVWMTEVRELSYDMEDSIDDFMQRIDDKDAKPEGFLENIKHSLGKLRKMMTRHRIGKEIQDLKQQVIEVGERNARYKNREAFSKTINATVDPRALAIFEHASKLVGIEEPKAEIIKLLTQEDGVTSTQRQLPQKRKRKTQQHQQIKVVSIVGSGGMGKTTLANQVYQELKGKFECQAFLSVSRNPDMMNIMRTILSEVSNQRYADTEAGSIQQLVSKINDFLADKRYFIVVDDIWKKETWEVIKCVFPTTNSGSRIITTTRMTDVAHSCRSSFNGHIYDIKPLGMLHSRQLFHRRLFNPEEDCPSYLEEVSEQILKKCAGLPLAIIAICGLLANTERTEHLWKQVKDSIGRALERNDSVEGMIKILSLSYFDLPPRLKTCLLYLSIYPEDSIIMMKVLIRRWIAEGFIHREGNYTAYKVGETCFNELINRSLIQPGNTDKYGGMVESCRVHDTILDFIISKSIEENFVTLVGVPNPTIRTQSKVRRLSLQVEEGGNSMIPTSMVLSYVRSLSVFGKSVDIPSLDKLKHVRVLDFEGCSQLENHHLAYILRLFQLRYLNLRRTKVSELPEQIGRLQCLEMLDLRDTSVRELPAATVNLRKLVYLLVHYDVKFPDGIAKMQALEVLKHVTVLKQPLKFPQELGQLKNLRKLHLDFEDDSATEDTMGVTNECEKAIGSCLHDLGTHENLRSLTIVNGSSFLQQGSSCPVPVSLQKLMIWSSVVPQVPNWVGSLVNLQELRLEVEGVGQEDLCILGALPTLRFLLLIGRAKSKGSLRVSGEVGFSYLRKFWYDMDSYAMDLMFASGSMPKLEKLKIGFNAEETESVTSGAFDFGIENLPCLVTVDCIACDFMIRDSAARAAMERAVSTHPNHPTLSYFSTRCRHSRC
jgi:disease resistance protein RPM1